MVTLSEDGFALLSIAISVNARCDSGSNIVSEGQVACRKPLRHLQAAAHSILASLLWESCRHTRLRASGMAGVMGRRRLELTRVAFFTPFRTYSTWGME